VPGKSGRVIGAGELASMRPQSFLINTARGSLVDEDALYAALISGKIAGAALDVHAHEPRGAGDRFLALPNVVLTPHIAGGSRLGVLDEARAIFENLGDVLGGAHPRHARIA
jgi:phosphoglycerate dehydrogenase-like enzyme